MKISKKIVIFFLIFMLGIEIPAMPVKAASKTTIKELLQTAMKPVGTTMYVWGGGWNKSDTAAGTEARTIGISPAWKKYFKKQTASYNFKKTKYKRSKGLDCSGYIGWCIYNVMNTKSGKKGYVMKAKKMASNFASRGWGTYKSRKKVKNYKAGDIMSSDCSCCGHVWMVIGQCEDGSVVLVHSSAPGVRISGTTTKSGSYSSQAIQLAKKYMKKYYPAWYRKYPSCGKNATYLSHYSQMRWTLSNQSGSVMSDPDGYRNMTPEEILKDLFHEK
ncbi:MAG: hypothetical protein Q4B70_01130 [Lachnospiraceae bacterium]|nr:hypothetical protein [Lachnospiraceae bacterium]